jgi:putative hemolysin
LDAGGWLALGLLLAALLLLLIVGAAEAGVASMSRARVRALIARGIPHDEALEAYLRDRHSPLRSLAVGRSLTIIASVALALFLVLEETGHTWSALIITAIGSLVVLSLLQALPRFLVAQSPERWELRLAPVIRALRVTFSAPAWLMELPARALLRLAGRRAAPLEGGPDSDELVRMMEIEESNGRIEEPERRMIRGIINLEETSVHEIMVPRIDVVAVESGAALDEVTRIITERGYSRIPLYEETIDNIVGVLYAKDIMKYLAGGGDRSTGNLRDLARPPFFVPESKKVDELLADMRANRVHMGIVVDEYGGTAGLVTIEDMLEEIVGEIEDEYDREEPTVEKINELEVIVDGRVSVDDLNELLGLQLEGEDYDTVGGFVYQHLGKIPVVGDEVQADGLQMRVLSVLGRRIKKIRVRKEPPPPANGNGSNGR